MRKLPLFGIFCLLSFNAHSADTFETSTNHLLIPKLLAADGTQLTNSFVGLDLRIQIKDVFSVGKKYPASSRSINSKPDYFDTKLGRLLIPQVLVGDTIYEDLIVSIDKVISSGTVSEILPNENDFSYEYNLHDSLPEDWKTEFTLVMNSLIELIPIKGRSGFYHAPIFAWNSNTNLPYSSVTGSSYGGSSISGGSWQDVGGQVTWMQLEIPDTELQNKDMHRYSVIPHEFFHIYQIARSPNFRIKWMMEGSAATFESIYMQQYYDFNYFLSAQTNVDKKYINDAKLLELYESLEPNYASSVFTTLVLSKELQKSGLSEIESFKKIFKEFYAKFPTTINWETLFSETFEMTVTEFYAIVKTYKADISLVVPNENLRLQDIFKE
jgi:hypothetical protein